MLRMLDGNYGSCLCFPKFCDVTADWLCRRKLVARIAELEEIAEQAKNKAARLEKEKLKLTIEIRDIAAELEAVISVDCNWIPFVA